MLAADAALRSVPLNAVTVNVYEMPPTRPVTTIGLPWPDAVAVPGDDFTVYEVAVPVPGVKAMLAWPSPAVAVTAAGMPGGASAMNGLSARSVQPGMCARK